MPKRSRTKNPGASRQKIHFWGDNKFYGNKNNFWGVTKSLWAIKKFAGSKKNIWGSYDLPDEILVLSNYYI